MPSTLGPSFLIWILGTASPFFTAVDEVEVKFADCPPAVRKAFQAEAPGVKFEDVTREVDDENETIYWAEATIGGRAYAIGVAADGTLSEMVLAFDDEEIPLDRCPTAVQATLKEEAFGEKVSAVARQMKFGVTLYEAAVSRKGRTYAIAVAEDGTLFEKVLVIDDEEIELDDCPVSVREAFKAQAKGGQVHDVTRTTGIHRPTFEASVEVGGQVYLVELDDAGKLISKTLDAGEE